MHMTLLPTKRRAILLALQALSGLLFSGVSFAADFRGFASEGPAGLLVYQTCQGSQLSKELLRLSDKTPNSAISAGFTAVRDVMRDKERPMFVEFTGEQSGKLVTARRFQRAIGHVESCAALPKDLRGARLLASGTEPNWRFVVDSAGGRLEMDGRKPVRFPASAFAASGKSGRERTFDAWSPQDGGTVRVEVTEELCRQDAAETAMGARVVLRYGSTAVEGCAARF